jgi:GNAT superfamily N-acetyltransferase
MAMTIDVTDAPHADALKLIEYGVLAFNSSQVGPTGRRPLAAVITDPQTGATVGGLAGRTAWSWFYIEWLFVAEPLRGQGLASRAMRQAEAEAIKRGCAGAWLDTYSFQARGFYERMGFAVVGQIDGYPPGQTRYFMKKLYPGIASPD